MERRRCPEIAARLVKGDACLGLAAALRPVSQPFVMDHLQQRGSNPVTMADKTEYHDTFGDVQAQMNARCGRALQTGSFRGKERSRVK